MVIPFLYTRLTIKPITVKNTLPKLRLNQRQSEQGQGSSRTRRGRYSSTQLDFARVYIDICQGRRVRGQEDTDFDPNHPDCDAFKLANLRWTKRCVIDWPTGKVSVDKFGRLIKQMRALLQDPSLDIDDTPRLFPNLASLSVSPFVPTKKGSEGSRSVVVKLMEILRLLDALDIETPESLHVCIKYNQTIFPRKIIRAFTQSNLVLDGSCHNQEGKSGEVLNAKEWIGHSYTKLPEQNSEFMAESDHTCH